MLLVFGTNVVAEGTRSSMKTQFPTLFPSPAVLGVLYPDSAKTKTFASPLMDSFTRQMVIPDAFSDAPDATPPRRPNRTLDILEIIKSSLLLFDKDFVDDAASSSFNNDHGTVVMNRACST